MENQDLEQLKYPVGKFIEPSVFDQEKLKKYIAEIEELPALIQSEYELMKKNGSLDKPYRPNGWTGRQVLHHLPDSHMNALIRVKLTLTEEHPTIKPYMEALWANLPDVMDVDTQVSIDLLKSIHIILISLLKSMKIDDFNRSYFHPESKKDFKLSSFTALYAWHGKHHLGHLKLINKS